MHNSDLREGYKWHRWIPEQISDAHQTHVAIRLAWQGQNVGMGDTYRYTDNIDTNIAIAITILYFVYRDNH